MVLKNTLAEYLNPNFSATIRKSLFLMEVGVELLLGPY